MEVDGDSTDGFQTEDEQPDEDLEKGGIEPSSCMPNCVVINPLESSSDFAENSLLLSNSLFVSSSSPLDAIGETDQRSGSLNTHRGSCRDLCEELSSEEKPEHENLVVNSDEEKQFMMKCLWTKCDREFLHLDDLVNHVNDDHVKSDKETDFTCRWEGCARKGKAFNARYKMLIHVRTHTNEKPHQCKECGKSFSRLENLKIHNRSHTGEKPYVCHVQGCSKAYSNSSDRFKHTRTHFVDKPYICKRDGCNKRYTDPSSLRKHMKTYGHYRENVAYTPKEKTGMPNDGVSSLTTQTNGDFCPLLAVNVTSLVSANPMLSATAVRTSADDSKVNGASALFEQRALFLVSANGDKRIKAGVDEDPKQNEASPLDLTMNNQMDLNEGENDSKRAMTVIINGNNNNEGDKAFLSKWTL